MQGIFVVEIKDGNRNQETESREHLLLRKIEEEVVRLEHVSAEITMRHAIFSQLRDSVREMIGIFEKPKKNGTQTEPENTPVVGSEPEPETPNLTENEQLEMLERGLRHAVGVLESTKMAYYFKTIKQLRENLAGLVKNGDAPIPERIAELKAGLRHAVKVLGESPRAMKSKVTRNLWENLVTLLENIA